jgi:hypothetical protein
LARSLPLLISKSIGSQWFGWNFHLGTGIAKRRYMTSENQSNLRQIMVWGSAVGAGFGAGSLAALRPHLDFAFSYKPVVAFLVAAMVVYFYWQLIFRSLDEPGLRVRRNAATVLLCFLGVAGLLYPIRFIAPTNYGEVLTGLITAFIALSGVAMLLLLMARFFNDEKLSEETPVGR